MNIDFNLMTVVMLFVILVSIQLTLNKIFVVLKEIRDIMNIKKTRDL